MTPALQVDGHPGVFVVGDFAEIPQPDAGEPLPMLAQVAIQSGRQAGRNIGALLREDIPQPFRYKDLGTMATVGRGFAVADIGPVRLSGQPGFLAWLVVHIARIAGMRTRALALTNRVSGYLFRNRPVRLIVGPRGSGPRTAPRPGMTQEQEGDTRCRSEWSGWAGWAPTWSGG
ncbi:hypothetical protein AB0K74_22750 [Streptomyces sp. NPDC056159]|uniref:hypothetical protein n=1 Tax=Streptomyces sp. NPDC056159 TaxID=3155537 RepID=UPI0034293835